MTGPLLVRPNRIGSHTVEIRDHNRAAIINQDEFAIRQDGEIVGFDYALIREMFMGNRKPHKDAFAILDGQVQKGETLILGVPGKNSNYTFAYRVRLVNEVLQVLERLPVRKLTKQEDEVLTFGAEDPNGAENWTDEELEAAVRCYIEMKNKADLGEPYTKVSYYRALHEEFGRSVKSYEFRMQNISYVYSLLGRRWIEGLPPAKNVGSRVAGIIEEKISLIEGSDHAPVVAFEMEVAAFRRASGHEAPTGTDRPKTTTTQTIQFVRDPRIVAWVLNAANGVCECCQQDAPFTKSDGTAYLEVHHVRRLADGGSDRIENAVAICPNCHRELHYGGKRTQLLSSLFQKIRRLELE